MLGTDYPLAATIGEQAKTMACTSKMGRTFLVSLRQALMPWISALDRMLRDEKGIMERLRNGIEEAAVSQKGGSSANARVVGDGTGDPCSVALSALDRAKIMMVAGSEILLACVCENQSAIAS